MSLLQIIDSRLRKNDKVRIINDCHEENITNGKTERWAHLKTYFVMPKIECDEKEIKIIFNDLFKDLDYSSNSVQKIRSLFFQENIGEGEKTYKAKLTVDDVPFKEGFFKKENVFTKEVILNRAIVINIFPTLDDFRKYKCS